MIKNKEKKEMTGQKLSQTVVLHSGDSVKERFGAALKLLKNQSAENATIVDMCLIKIGMDYVTCEVIYIKGGDSEGKGGEVKPDKMTVHGANGFTETICGIPFAKTTPCRMTNVTEEVTCEDCKTIIQIKEKNQTEEKK